MRTTSPAAARTAALFAMLLAFTAADGAGPAGAAADAAAVVKSFNAAVTARSVEKAVGHFVTGGVQFNIRPAHTGLGGAQQGVTTELTAHWSMIGPVLFAATKSYSRQVEVLDSRAEGDVATVWTRTRTETLRADRAAPGRDEFLEIYLLVRTGGAWKIGAIADNRVPNDVGIGASRP
jgi:hypothetical protein